MQVIEAIVEARLPVSMSTKPDFSDVVPADGNHETSGAQCRELTPALD
jgi:hypothetical protein